ncbi:MAG: XdhC family protein [Pseudomonadota bacterium]
MTQGEIYDLIQDMRAQDRPFCVATVVRTADLTSAKAGAKAVISSDGEIQGHLGGGCVLGAVKRATREALASGATRMIRIRPDEADTDVTGIEVMPNGCPSGGTVDIFIEPFHLPPSLRVIGTSPIAKAIQAHAELMGFRIDSGAPSKDPDHLSPDFIIIATQGSGDVKALRTAIESDTDYITMIASHRKADVLKQRLIEDGADPQKVERVHSPAGLDLGAIGPHEIAISILAHMIQWRRQQQR